ncbi:MAG TPA: glycoside hydrolase family 2 TIM barrel-domain containing protein [Chitinophagaceae bacterium]
MSPAHAQERISKTINSNWLFMKGDTLSNEANKWTKVSIPHTWNADDVMDDESGYYRGEGWYKKTIYLPRDWKEKEIYIYFEGAAQVAEVFVNGKQVGKHTGSYTAFSFPINKYLNYSETGNTANELMVKVNNSHDENIPPLSGDYTFFGGIYRDVYLVALNEIHFDADNDASKGIFITTPVVTDNIAEVSIKGAFENTGRQEKKLTVTHTIFDADGKRVKELRKNFKAKPGEKVSFQQDMKDIKGQQLWSVENPYLYRVVSTISQAGTNIVLDEISNPLGFRYFKFDAEKGFFLNGKHVKLVGASRHQDFKGLGNALPDAMHVRDVELLKEMGGNFLRIAHYPQDPAILEACDRLGILASVETPSGNHITESEAFAENSLAIQREMIRQNFNHPSLIIWAYMNEVLLRPPYEKGSAQQEAYFTNVTKLAQRMEVLTRKEDAGRYTMIPNHGSFELYNRVQLTQIPMLVGWNLYLGWYSRSFEGFGDFLDKHRKELPDKPLLVSEYGADADSRVHDFNPVRFDKTVEYATIYHQEYLKAMMDRPFVAAAMIWNLAEFSSEQRGETTPHINAKGILTQDRKVKDAYLFYQANLLSMPFIQIGSKEWNIRTGFAASENTLVCEQPVTVFSNQKEVSLKLNGKLLGSSPTRQGIAQFSVPFINGLNRITASTIVDGIEVTDQVNIHFRLLSQNLKSNVLPFNEMNISLGDKRFFYDENSAQVWIPEQEYTPGSWGYVGGKPFTMKNTSRHSYGSDKDILGTNLDPVFATQRMEIRQFKMDVPNGDYEITLHFAELISPVQKEALAYNLGNEKAAVGGFEERAFDVAINNQKVLSGLSNLEDLQPERAVSFKFSISVNNNKGITIDFNPLMAETILNGIQVEKIR